jgi:hypothetical protein
MNNILCVRSLEANCKSSLSYYLFLNFSICAQRMGRRGVIFDTTYLAIYGGNLVLLGDKRPDGA